MINHGKHNVIGVMIDAVDYEEAIRRITGAAKARMPFACSALAVHGIMTGYRDPEHRTRLNTFDLIVPDGQPVRWALNILHQTALTDRVYGPKLMLEVCRAAERHGLGVYLYGSTEAVLAKLVHRLQDQFPCLQICGYEASKFRHLTCDEKHEIVSRIRASGAHLTFVGLGCPRQEVWAYEYRQDLSMPILAVGAAFDFHAGTTSQAPEWMQRRGLEWLFRLQTEPKRLWKRYLLLNPWYSQLVACQLLGLKEFPTTPVSGAISELSHG